MVKIMIILFIFSHFQHQIPVLWPFFFSNQSSWLPVTYQMYFLNFSSPPFRSTTLDLKFPKHLGNCSSHLWAQQSIKKNNENIDWSIQRFWELMRKFSSDWCGSVKWKKKSWLMIIRVAFVSGPICAQEWTNGFWTLISRRM